MKEISDIYRKTKSYAQTAFARPIHYRYPHSSNASFEDGKFITASI